MYLSLYALPFVRAVDNYTVSHSSCYQRSIVVTTLALATINIFSTKLFVATSATLFTAMSVSLYKIHRMYIASSQHNINEEVYDRAKRWLIVGCLIATSIGLSSAGLIIYRSANSRSNMRLEELLWTFTKLTSTLGYLLPFIYRIYKMGLDNTTADHRDLFELYDHFGVDTRSKQLILCSICSTIRSYNSDTHMAYIPKLLALRCNFILQSNGEIDQDSSNYFDQRLQYYLPDIASAICIQRNAVMLNSMEVKRVCVKEYERLAVRIDQMQDSDPDIEAIIQEFNALNNKITDYCRQAALYYIPINEEIRALRKSLSNNTMREKIMLMAAKYKNSLDSQVDLEDTLWNYFITYNQELYNPALHDLKRYNQGIYNIELYNKLLIACGLSEQQRDKLDELLEQRDMGTLGKFVENCLTTQWQRFLVANFPDCILDTNLDETALKRKKQALCQFVDQHLTPCLKNLKSDLNKEELICAIKEKINPNQFLSILNLIKLDITKNISIKQYFPYLKQQTALMISIISQVALKIIYIAAIIFVTFVEIVNINLSKALLGIMSTSINFPPFLENRNKHLWQVLQEGMLNYTRASLVGKIRIIANIFISGMIRQKMHLDGIMLIRSLARDITSAAGI